MVFMESYLFCASVRLGVIVISAFALTKSIIIIYVISTQGIDFSFSLISIYDINSSYRPSYYMVKDTIHWLEQYPEIATLLVQFYCICHVFSCVMAAFGAYKLKKYYVIPLAIFQFVFMWQTIMLSTLLLRILRHFVSLEKLIFLTVTATAYILLVIYDFLALISFEQIVRLVRSKRYQQLYGSDPFNPILNPAPKKPNFDSHKHQFQQHPNIVIVMPKMDTFLPKWWQLESVEKFTSKENINLEDAHKNFHTQELLAGALLHNAINLGYNQRKML